MPTKKYYAFLIPATGESGVTDSWPVCEKKTSGVAGARYRSFKTNAAAEEWLHAGATYELKAQKPKLKLRPGIYFDSGTGRGDGVEISVTDERGRDILFEALSSRKLNRHGKMNLPAWATNNYGELLAMRYALELALQKKVKHIFGDSKLILDYWSLGIAREKELSQETLKLIRKTAKLREEFEAQGGAATRIPGGQNPADLGFH